MRLFIFLLSLCLFSSCLFFEDGGEAPALLDVKLPTLKQQNAQGGNTHEIIDIWPFVDGLGLGVFELPRTIPVILNNDETEFSIFAGIRNNGNRSNTIIYPFYKNIEFSSSLSPSDREDLELEFEYRENAVFGFLENFEQDNRFVVDEDDDEMTSLQRTSTDAAHGVYAGALTVSAENPSLEVSNGLPFSLPTDGSAVFLEIDYKGDTELVMGLIGVEGRQEFKKFIIVLVPQEDWQKIYVSLNEELLLSQLESYKLIFGIDISNRDLEQATVLIDNIKVVHF